LLNYGYNEDEIERIRVSELKLLPEERKLGNLLLGCTCEDCREENVSQLRKYCDKILEDSGDPCSV